MLGESGSSGALPVWSGPAAPMGEVPKSVVKKTKALRYCPA